MKENDFLCPYCRGYLKPHNKIILSGRKDSGSRGIILFNPQLGEYDILHHDTFSLEEGEHLDILCPLCHANLTDQTISKNLARIKMIDTSGKEFDIYFSEIVGMKCTYKISEDKKVESYGEDAEEYRNYWGVVPRY
jgi:hypothetical protein